MRDGLRYEWIRNTNELEQLAPEWNALWKADEHATPFQSPEWLVPWWHCFGAELRSIAILRDDALMGLLPFYLHRQPRSGERHLLPLGVGTTDYLDGIFSPRLSGEDVSGALELLYAQDDWDALYVSQLRLGSKLLEALELSPPGGRRIESQSCSRMPAVLMGELPQKIRRNAMYYRNRAQRAGPLELTIADESNRAEAFDALLRLHTERWRERGEPGVFADERMIRWHREALPLLERLGVLRLCSLRLNGEIIAVMYALIDPPGRTERTEYFYLPGYSIAHADLRPGTLLIALATEHAAGEGVRAIDMLRGDEEYKKIWHMEQTPTLGFVRYREASRQERTHAGEKAA